MNCDLAWQPSRGDWERSPIGWRTSVLSLISMLHELLQLVDAISHVAHLSIQFVQVLSDLEIFRRRPAGAAWCGVGPDEGAPAWAGVHQTLASQRHDCALRRHRGHIETLSELPYRRQLVARCQGPGCDLGAERVGNLQRGRSRVISHSFKSTGCVLGAPSSWTQTASGVLCV